jgi:riboflavin biosynthesis pyrimidine reductase/pyrimidine deaminase RibD-like protein
MFTEFDRLAMTRALALAERGLETTHPNPRVGCVIAKGDRIIAEGWHERAGEAHAEVAAIRSAKEPVAGATAYVTLEPCSHHGRTPPCVNALIEARIARVVFAVQDPNPRVSGQGADALLRAGITVEAGLMQAEATEINIGFMKRMRDGLPWVRVKLAMSLDGRTALANGASQWITSESARADVQRWRARCSAVMTGVGTVIADDPQLNVRLAGFKGRQPLRVVLDARLRSPVRAKMFAGLGGGGVGAAGAGTGAATARLGVEPPAVDVAGPIGGPANVGAGRAGAAAGAITTPEGDVLIFTAVGSGPSAAGSARPAVPVDPSALAGDLAELVNAFETSPTSVAARSVDLAGPVSVKAELPGAASVAASGPLQSRALRAPAGAAGAADGPVGFSGPGGPGGASAAGGAASGDGDVAPGPGVAATATAARGAESASGADVAAHAGAGTSAASGIGAVGGSSPPILAAATSAAGVAPAADDATWAGAALSGAVPVNGGTKVSADASASALVVGSASGGSNGDGPTTQTASGPMGSATTVAAGVTARTLASPTAGSDSRTAAAQPSPATAAQPSRAATAQPSSAGAADGANASIVEIQRGATAAKPAARPDSQVGRLDSSAAFQARRAALAARGVRIEEVAADDGFLDLFAVLKRLGELEVNEVLVEAGPTLAGQLFTTFFADELLLYIAPKLLGPQGRPLVNLPELQTLQDAWGFALFDAKRFGDDLRVRMRPK